MLNIKVIVGSVRPQRFGIQPAEWITELAKTYKDTNIELVDLEKVALPFLDEPVPPLMDKYSKDHTFAWAKVIGDADGFVFVTPEYNHGYSPALKNAIDFLAKEWYYKPAAFVSYGAAAGGARAIDQLRPVVGQLRMYDLSDAVSIANYWTQLGDGGKFQPSETQASEAHAMLKQLVFWSEKMKAARTELAAQSSK